MLVFKSDLGAYFKVTGIFISAEKANEFLVSRPNEGVIGEVRFNDQTFIIVADFDEVSKGTIKPATKAYINETGTMVGLIGCGVTRLLESF